MPSHEHIHPSLSQEARLADLHRGIRKETRGAGGVLVALGYLMADLLQQVGAVDGRVGVGGVERKTTTGRVEGEARGL